MASVVAKAALGPRPGPYIMKFWQGSVEIVLRATAVVSFTSLSDVHTLTAGGVRSIYESCFVCQKRLFNTTGTA